MKRKALLVGVKPASGLIGPWIRIYDGESWVVEGPGDMIKNLIIHVEEVSGTFRTHRAEGNSITPFSGHRVRVELEESSFKGPFSLELKEVRNGGRT